jgi:hypothetical protein
MNTPVIHATRFAELGYRQDGPALWRFVDRSTQASVGPQHPTKTALLADLERYGYVFGCAGAKPPAAPALEVQAELIDVIEGRSAEPVRMKDLRFVYGELTYENDQGEERVLARVEPDGRWRGMDNKTYSDIQITPQVVSTAT